MIEKKNEQPFPWNLFLAEMAGMALLLSGGLSIVILMFGNKENNTVSHNSKGLQYIITRI